MKISVMNGDSRNAKLTQILGKEGFEAKLFEKEQIADASEWGQVIVLPIKGMDSDLFNGYLNHGQSLVTGQDFLSRQDFTILNCIPTVEGALQIAMQKTPVTIHGSKVLVIGYGRIGKLLADKLSALGAETVVSARKQEDFAWLSARRIPYVNTMALQGALGDYDIIFNTVPHMVLPYTLLCELKKTCLIIDLASQPGGVDFKAAEKLGLQTEWALSLPGKVAPDSAARYMKDTLINILRERGILA